MHCLKINLLFIIYNILLLSSFLVFKYFDFNKLKYLQYKNLMR